MNIDSLEKITPSVAVNSGIFIFSFLCPGFLLFFVNSPQLMESLDFLKLCVLSVAISSPTFIVPYCTTVFIFTAMKYLKTEKLELYGDHADWYVRHGITNSLNMYLIVFVSYVFGLSWKTAAWVVLGVIIINVVTEVLLLRSFIRDPEGSLALQLHRPSSGK